MCPKCSKFECFRRYKVMHYDAQIRDGYGRDTKWIKEGHGFYTKKMKHQIQDDTIVCLI